MVRVINNLWLILYSHVSTALVLGSLIGFQVPQAIVPLTDSDHSLVTPVYADENTEKTIKEVARVLEQISSEQTKETKVVVQAPLPTKVEIVKQGSQKPLVLAKATTSSTTTSISAVLDKYFSDAPVMKRVAFCESTHRHYTADGSVLRGRVDNRDHGLFQINSYYHGNTSARMGIDTMTLEGNAAYARYLYDTQGLQPWSASRPCWG